MQKRWKLLESDKVKTEQLFQSLHVHPAICNILVQRGIQSFQESKDFFRPQLSQLHSPFLMKDMQKAVDRILLAFKQKEKILVYGDYDVDGTTSVACMYQFLKQVFEEVDYYIPHRYREGYGVSKAGIDFAKENGFTLIVSLDCGIKSADLIAYAKTLDIDFIVCDHHLPDDIIPAAAAILNPKQIDCNYPYKELCGCGVGFKLMQALSLQMGIDEKVCWQYLDLVATAIAADIVPITGENRILAHYGLKRVNENPCAGIAALKRLAKVEKEMNISSLVFLIAPRINAAGRMDDAKKAVQLFIAENETQATAFAEILHQDNTDRKEKDSSISEEAFAMLDDNKSLQNRMTTVLYQPHWHKGVVGIVASRLIERYYRPTVVLTKSGDYLAGSARSVPGFNLYEAIHACRKYLLGYGGHFAAAGLTMLPENVEAFAAAFEKVVAATITPELLIPEIIIDTELNFADIKFSFYNIMQQMEPFGPDNMRLIFLSKNVINTGFSKVVKEQHIKFHLQQNDITLNGIGFNMADKYHILEENKPIDIVYQIELNEWNGEKSLQIKMIDFKLSE